MAVKLADLTGTTIHVGHRVDLERSLQKVKRALDRELDDQGVTADNPLRAVIYRPVDAIAITRDPQGRITGAVCMGVDDSRSYPRVTIDSLRASPWSTSGTGTALLAEAARIAQALNAPLAIHGPLATAIGFYERMGAEFANDSSSVGYWTDERRDALAAGTPIAAPVSGRACTETSTSGR